MSDEPREFIPRRAEYGRRAIDATRISFDLKFVVFIVTGFLSVGLTFWASTAGMRSDVRDILTKMNSQSEKLELQQKLQDEKMANLREQVMAMQRRVELMQYEQAALKEAVLRGDQKVTK